MKPSRVRIPVAVALLLLAPSAFGAAAAQPSATAPAADFSSPRAALKTLYTALRAGDLPAALHAMTFANKDQERRVRTNLTPLWAPLSLMHAMEKRFGPDADRLFSDASLLKTADNALAAIEHIDIEVEGDHAVVGQKEAGADPNAENELTGIHLEHTAEGWKIVAGTFQDAASEVPPNQAPTMQAISDSTAQAVATTIKRLQNGEFRTADEAYAAYHALLASAERAHVPPPGPATRHP